MINVTSGENSVKIKLIMIYFENYHNQCKLIYFSKSSLKLYLKKLEVNTNYFNYGHFVPIYSCK